MSRVDTHDGLYWLAAACGALLAALVVSAATGGDTSNEPAPTPAHYQHPEEP